MSGAELFTVFGKLALNKTDFDRDINEADKSGQDLANNLTSYMEKAKNFLGKLAIGLTIKKLATDMWDLLKTTSAAGDRIDKQSQALGLSRKGFQEWDYILGQSGASIDSLGSSMKTLNSAILGGSDDTAAAVSRLGLTVAQLSSMSPEEQFEAVVTALQKMPEGALKTQVAMTLLGRNAQSLMPLLNSEAGSIDELKQRAHELGLIMSDEDVDASVAFGDALDDLSRTWNSLKMRIGAQLLPGFTRMFYNLATSLGRVSTSLSDAIKTGNWNGFFRTLNDEIEAILPEILEGLGGFVVGFFENADKFVRLAVTIVTGLATAIVDAMPILVAKLPEILEIIKGGLHEVSGSIKEMIVGLLTEAMEEAGVQNSDGFKDFLEKYVFVGFEDLFANLGEVEWVKRIGEWFDNSKEATINFTADVGDWFVRIWDWIEGAAEDVNTATINFLADVGDWFVRIWDWIKGTAEDAKTATINFAADVGDWFERIWDWIGNKANEAKIAFAESTIGDWFTRVWDWIGDKANEAKISFADSKIGTWIQRIYDWVTNGVSVAVSFFGDKVSGLVDIVGGWFGAGGDSDEEPYVPGPNYVDYAPKASGMNYVPYDGFRAELHRGEAILNASNGREWRQGKSGFDMDALYGNVASAVASAVSGIAINLDGRAVGNAVTQQVSRNMYQEYLTRRFG